MNAVSSRRVVPSTLPGRVNIHPRSPYLGDDTTGDDPRTTENRKTLGNVIYQIFNCEAPKFHRRSDPDTEMGKSLAPRFTNYLTVLDAWERLQKHHSRAALVVYLRFGPENLPVKEIAKVLGIGDKTVSQELVRGVDFMIEIVWENPRRD